MALPSMKSTWWLNWCTRAGTKVRDIGFLQVIPLCTPLTPHRQGIPHALDTWDLQEDMTKAPSTTTLRFYSFYTLFAHFGHDIDDNSPAAYLPV